MADRPKVLMESALYNTGSGSVGFYRIPQWSTSDTITLGDFTTITSAQAVRGDTLAAVTTTVATNQVTLTQAAMANVLVVIMVWGIR